MPGKAARNKGHNFERKVAIDFREIWPDAKRGFQTRNNKDEQPDVVVPHFFIECKAHKISPLRGALAQAKRLCPEDKIPLAICKDDRKTPIVLMEYPDFLKLVKEWQAFKDIILEEGEGLSGHQKVNANGKEI